jgi:hypothetical protein
MLGAKWAVLHRRVLDLVYDGHRIHRMILRVFERVYYFATTLARVELRQIDSEAVYQ